MAGAAEEVPGDPLVVAGPAAFGVGVELDVWLGSSFLGADEASEMGTMAEMTPDAGAGTGLDGRCSRERSFWKGGGDSWLIKCEADGRLVPVVVVVDAPLDGDVEEPSWVVWPEGVEIPG